MRTHLLLVLVVCVTSLIPAKQEPRSTVWAIDFVQTKDGQFENYMRFIDANWRTARDEMQRAGAVVSFSVSIDPTGAKDWNVMLLTEYADLTQFEAREQSYQRAIAKVRPNGVGPTLIEGKGARDLSSIKFSRVLHTRVPGPR